MSDSITPRFSEPRDEEVAEYRSVSRAAVGCLILGLLSPAALVDPVVWFIPFLGIVVGAFALVLIRQNAPVLSGRKIAMWGLCLSLCFAAAAPADWLYYRYRIREEAKQYAALWFDLLASGRPERAFQLMVETKNRAPLDENLWEFYRQNPLVRKSLEKFVAPAKEGNPSTPVRTLMALGKSANVHYFDSPLQISDPAMETVYLRYAVTFDDLGKKKTFFLIAQLLRLKGGEGSYYWKIISASPEKKAEAS